MLMLLLLASWAKGIALAICTFMERPENFFDRLEPRLLFRSEASDCLITVSLFLIARKPGFSGSEVLFLIVIAFIKVPFSSTT